MALLLTNVEKIRYVMLITMNLLSKLFNEDNDTIISNGFSFSEDIENSNHTSIQYLQQKPAHGILVFIASFSLRKGVGASQSLRCFHGCRLRQTSSVV